MPYKNISDKRISQRLWARHNRETLREELIALLGKSCLLCDSQEHLEVDHPNGRQWDITKLWSTQRIKRYFLEAKTGEVRLLCKTCNLKHKPGNLFDKVPF